MGSPTLSPSAGPVEDYRSLGSTDVGRTGPGPLLGGAVAATTLAIGGVANPC